MYERKIEILREKSRTLLGKLAENSKIIESEIEKLNIDRNIFFRPCISELKKKTCSSWLIRNDSKRVSELLNPLLNEEMTVGGSILISSKCLGNQLNLRKTVPECYCNRIPRKVQYRSPRSVFKPFELCHHCKSYFNVPAYDIEELDEAPLSPGLNAETLQRVQSITYTPRSKFLRRVQKKVSQQFNTCREQSEITLKLSHQYSSHTSPRNQGNHDEWRETGGGSNRVLSKYQTDNQAFRQNEIIDLYDESTIIDPHPGEVIQVPVQVHRANNSAASMYNESREKTTATDTLNVPKEKRSSNTNKSMEKGASVEQTQRDFSPEIEIIFPPKVSQKKSMKNNPKKTISSTKRNDEKKKHKKRKSAERRKQNGRKSYYDSCCSVSNRQKNSAILSKCGDCCCHSDRCLSCLASVVTLGPENDSDKKVVELRKFREMNYYDTHDSSQTVLSSSILSSGTLEKYELNNRLFPEPIGKVYKDDIIISMPPCATKQLERIHYLTRYIVRENKSARPIYNSNKKCKHTSCPLTGHAIDVALLKPTVKPSNSLALKYQKGTV